MNSLEAKNLLLIETQHSRSSCSDESPSNAYTTEGRGGTPRCTRCTLLRAADYEEYAGLVTAAIVPARVEVKLSRNPTPREPNKYEVWVPTIRNVGGVLKYVPKKLQDEILGKDFEHACRRTFQNSTQIDGMDLSPSLEDCEKYIQENLS